VTTGTAYLPSGDSIWIVIESFAPAAFYPVAPADITSTAQSGNVAWSYAASIGSAKDDGQSFKIYAVILDKQISEYLSATTVLDSTGKVYSLPSESASAPELPPDVLAESSVSVTRKSGTQIC
jgi:hypothetical protein